MHSSIWTCWTNLLLACLNVGVRSCQQQLLFYVGPFYYAPYASLLLTSGPALTQPPVSALTALLLQLFENGFTVSGTHAIRYQYCIPVGKILAVSSS